MKKNHFKKKFFNYFSIIIFLFKNILFIFFFILLKIFLNNQNIKTNNKYQLIINEIKSLKEKKLYKNNKTEFYLYKRVKFLIKNHIKYNESNLITFQDKLNWLIIHESPEYKSDLVDKIKLHNYSIKILGKDICVPILKIYENVEEINLDELPKKFVIKLNHGSGMNIICKDKAKFNLKMHKEQLNKWKNINYGLTNNEFQYMYVNRKIFAEQFLSENLIDYKVFCFNGKAKFIRIRKILNNKKHIKIHNHYNLNWTLNELESGLKGYIRNPYIKIKRPKYLNLMIDYANKLSKEFVFVRVDFYEVNNRIYLGELTFSPSNAFITWKDNKQNIKVGGFMNLTKINKKLFNS